MKTIHEMALHISQYYQAKKSKMKTIREIVKSIGGDHEVARRTGVRPVTVRSWCSDGYIPKLHHKNVIELAHEKNIEIEEFNLDPKFIP